MTLTEERRKRVLQAMSETATILDKELEYSEDLQDKELIEFCMKHIENLTKMLN